MYINSTYSINSLKLEIFESCKNGEITKDEQDMLLNLLTEGVLKDLTTKIGSNFSKKSLKNDDSIINVKNEISRIKNVKNETKQNINSQKYIDGGKIK